MSFSGPISPIDKLDLAAKAMSGRDGAQAVGEVAEKAAVAAGKAARFISLRSKPKVIPSRPSVAPSESFLSRNTTKDCCFLETEDDDDEDDDDGGGGGADVFEGGGGGGGPIKALDLGRIVAAGLVAVDPVVDDDEGVFSRWLLRLLFSVLVPAASGTPLRSLAALLLASLLTTLSPPLSPLFSSVTPLSVA